LEGEGIAWKIMPREEEKRKQQKLIASSYFFPKYLHSNTNNKISISLKVLASRLTCIRTS